MYVCICNAVTERDIQDAVADGARNFEQLRACTGCSSTCGCCEPEARKAFAEALHAQRTRGFLCVVEARAA